MPKRVLIVDDRLESLFTCADLFKGHGYDVATCSESVEAIDVFKKHRPDAVVLDIRMPGRNGFDLLKDIRELDRRVCVVMLSAYGDVETVVSAMRLGADHFAEKSSDPEKVLIVVEKELKRKDMELELASLRADTGLGHVGIDHLIGDSPPMQAVKQQIRDYADTDEEILLTGECGVGKDFVAGVIHFESGRRALPFQHLFCPQIPETLFESEIFGHERGAFTGAHKKRTGIIEAAGGGTVFLNEFVDIPPDVQATLLLVIEAKVYMRVGGGGKTLKSNARFIAATNTDVDAARESGKMREDLFFRLNNGWIRIPPLRERGEDILLLAEHFIKVASHRLGRPGIELSDASKNLLLQYGWPGNVRELENVMKRAVMAGNESVISGDGSLTMRTTDVKPTGSHRLKDAVRSAAEAVEQDRITEALIRSEGNRKKAAEWLDISYRSLLSKMEKYDLRKRF
jgi:DNA-binding NtrC family response regulator